MVPFVLTVKQNYFVPSDSKVSSIGIKGIFPMPLSMDHKTARLVRVSSTISLLAGIIFFVYSAYAGTFLDGGSTQVFIGLTSLILLLAIHVMNEKVILQTHD
jgi:hypothetical protein